MQLTYQSVAVSPISCEQFGWHFQKQSCKPTQTSQTNNNTPCLLLICQVPNLCKKPWWAKEVPKRFLCMVNPFKIHSQCYLGCWRQWATSTAGVTMDITSNNNALQDPCKNLTLISVHPRMHIAYNQKQTLWAPTGNSHRNNNTKHRLRKTIILDLATL